VLCLVLSGLSLIAGFAIFTGALVCCIFWFVLIVPIIQSMGSFLCTIGAFAYEE
jgi:hypothetical protein